MRGFTVLLEANIRIVEGIIGSIEVLCSIESSKLLMTSPCSTESNHSTVQTVYGVLFPNCR